MIDRLRQRLRIGDTRRDPIALRLDDDTVIEVRNLGDRVELRSTHSLRVGVEWKTVTVEVVRGGH